MPYIPDQRPGSPTSFGNWQGLYDLATELPNVAGSSTQMSVPDLQRGDIAGVTSGQLTGPYICADPTPGAAVWERIATVGGSGGGGVASGEYTPTFDGFSGQATGAVAAAPWRWQRIGNTVAVWGEATVAVNPVLGVAGFEASLPFTPSVGTSANTVANMSSVPPTATPDATVFPYSTATRVGFNMNVSGVYTSVRVMTTFCFRTG